MARKPGIKSELLIGKQNGRWLCTGISRVKNYTTMMQVTCICGRSLEKTKHQFIQEEFSGIKKCGCKYSAGVTKVKADRLARDLENKRIGSEPYSLELQDRVLKIMRGGITRGIPYSLSYEETCQLATKPCHYCGFYKWREIGLDRVVNSAAYTLDNVVPCCFQCNRAKGTGTVAELLEYLERVYSYQAGKR